MRKNSQVAREIVVALPKELEADAQRHLVRGFVSEQCVSRGMVADVAYHDVGSGNAHAHVLLTTRRIDPDGFAGKDRSWNDRGLVQDWRREWVEHANRALARAQVMDRIDHRSLAAQRQDALQRGNVAVAAALDRAPGVHLGRAAHEEARTSLPAARVSRDLEAHHAEHRSPAEQSLGRPARIERPRPAGLQRISTFEREIRRAIETTAKALEACRQELRQLEERVARWLREMHERVREAEAQRQQRGGSQAPTGKGAVAEAGARSRRLVVRPRRRPQVGLMTGLRERMRENRDRIERLTESERILTVALQRTRDRLHEVDNALYGLRRSLNWLRILGPLIILALGFVGGLGAGLLLR